MSRTLVQEVPQQSGHKITLQGWVHTTRVHSQVAFIELRDRSGIVQVVVEKKSQPKLYTQVTELKSESVVTIIGQVTAQPQVELGYEVLAKKLTILSEPAAELPIPVVEKSQQPTSIKKRLDYRWIDLRKPERYTLFKLQMHFQDILRQYLIAQGFVEASTPKLMATPSESQAELFKVDYFGRPAYLAQSGQYYKQMAMASGWEKFFTFGDTYRADPSSTIWHVAQFITLDVEFSFIDGLEDVMQFEEKLIHHAMSEMKKRFGQKIKAVFGKDITVPELPFPRITTAEAKKIVQQMGSTEESPDLTTPEEKLLCKWMKKEYGHEFVFLTEFPWEVRPFYHMKSTPSTTRSADLLYKRREITTIAQREHRYDVLLKQIKEKGLRQSELQHYLDFFKYGCPPHGGFGFGVERLLMMILGLSNIREAIMLPRDMKRLKP